MMLDRIRGDTFHRRLADASTGETDDTQQRFVIAMIDREAEVTQRIFDLLALVERGAAVDAVGDIEFAELAFDDARLRVRSI